MRRFSQITKAELEKKKYLAGGGEGSGYKWTVYVNADCAGMDATPYQAETAKAYAELLRTEEKMWSIFRYGLVGGVVYMEVELI